MQLNLLHTIIHSLFHFVKLKQKIFYKKTENRNIDTAKARGELEEDLLEYVYRKWRQGRQITSKEYARTTGITTSEVLFLYKKYLVNSVLESKKTVAEGL